MDWEKAYIEKLVEPEEAAALVQPDDELWLPMHTYAHRLSRAIFAQRERLQRVHIRAGGGYFDAGWFARDETVFSVVIETFITQEGRKGIDSGKADFSPALFSRSLKADLERPGPGRRKVLLIDVSPPDAHGYCSYGTALWNKPTLARAADVILAEMHSTYPRTAGANFIHVRDIDRLVQGDDILPILPPRPEPDGIEQIAAFVAELIRDGDTIQTGTGSTTTGIIQRGAFDSKRDLGVHSETTAPGLVSLVQRGIITGERKTLHRGRFIAANLHLFPEELEFVNGNPSIELHDVHDVNDPRIIAQHDNMVAINNAIAVDLTGQIAAEAIGPKMWSGPGGQLEFTIGAMWSKGGRSLTLLPSTARGGTVSRIVATFAPGTVVSVPRQLADYVVTEHGIASLLGKSQRQRAEELIAIAHPDFRAELRRAAARL
jgi:acyl-CoA hydrolase